MLAPAVLNFVWIWKSQYAIAKPMNANNTNADPAKLSLAETMFAKAKPKK